MARRPEVVRSAPSLVRIFRRFWPQVRQQRAVIGGSFAALGVEIAFRLLEPWPLKFVFDRVIVATPSAGSSGVKTIDQMDTSTLLALAAAAVIVFAAMRACATYCSRVGFALAGNRVLTQSRADLFAHLQRLSLSFHHKSRTGDLITRVTSDVGRLKEVIITALLPMVAHTLTLICMLTIMVIMDWRLALAGLAILPVFVFSTQRFGKKIRRVARKQRKREGAIGAATAEAMGSIQTVQALSMEGQQQRAFTAQNKASLKDGVKGKRLSARLVGVVDVLIAIATAAVLLFGARFVMRGEMTPGDLIVFLAYLKTAFKPMRDLAKYSARIAQGAASAERIVELFDTEPAIEDRPDAVPMPVRVESIQFDQVTFAYTTGQDALKDVSLEVRPGQIMALAGKSGAGKTTVLNLLMRFYDPQSGAILWNGNDARSYTYKSLRRSIAIVPQDNVLFSISIRENISCGVADAKDEDIEAAARLARAHDFIMALPDGYDTVVAERGETLSQGQRQRIAIARAALRNAPVLVLDEPTSSLDNENNLAIREAIDELSRDRITIIIAHDLSTIESADIVLYLEDGRVRESGTHQELVAQSGRYAAMNAAAARTGREHDHVVSR